MTTQPTALTEEQLSARKQSTLSALDKENLLIAAESPLRCPDIDIPGQGIEWEGVGEVIVGYGACDINLIRLLKAPHCLDAEKYPGETRFVEVLGAKQVEELAIAAGQIVLTVKQVGEGQINLSGYRWKLYRAKSIYTDEDFLRDVDTGLGAEDTGLSQPRFDDLVTAARERVSRALSILIVAEPSEGKPPLDIPGVQWSLLEEDPDIGSDANNYSADIYLQELASAQHFLSPHSPESLFVEDRLGVRFAIAYPEASELRVGQRVLSIKRKGDLGGDRLADYRFKVWRVEAIESDER